MAVTRYATSSYSMSKSLHHRLKLALPRHGDRSKLVARLIEMYLNHEVIVTNVNIRRSRVDTSVALRNIQDTV